MQALTRNPLAEPRILGISRRARRRRRARHRGRSASARLAGWIWFGSPGAAVRRASLVFGVAARTRDGAGPVTLALVGAAHRREPRRGDRRHAQRRRGHVRAVPVLGGRRRSPAADRRDGRAGRAVPRSSALAARAWSRRAVWTRWRSATTSRAASATGSGGYARSPASPRSLLTGAAVAVAGPIAFVGLAVPHLARALVGAAHRWVLPLSALLGAALVLVARRARPARHAARRGPGRGRHRAGRRAGAAGGWCAGPGW